MIIDKLVQRFLDKPIYLDNGAGFLAKNWKCSKEDIYAAKEKARKLIHANETYVLQEIISQQEQQLAKYVGSESTEEGVVKKFESTRPLTPKEIEELVGVDKVNTYVARVWDKQQTSGIWTYSVDVRYRVKDFYSKEELEDKLKELMPDLTPYTIPIVEKPLELALVICIADDHAGAVNITDIFEKNKMTYKERLLSISQEVKMLGTSFEEVHIISLGDQMNGWNGQTTRGGHEVKSLSNKEQFDTYTEARIAFYNDIFSSGVGQTYFIHDVENSNHSGLGMSYMANKALEFYLDGKFPQVYRESVHDIIGGFEYGQHVIMYGHGKDEKLQKRPMPAVLNAQTDLYLYDYAQNKGYSPYDRTITFYKGDLHQMGLQHGKFGRYINVPSVAGNSDYGDINFGNTKGGAYYEIYDKNSYRVGSQSVWF